METEYMSETVETTAETEVDNESGDGDLTAENRGAEGLFASLHLIQELGDVDIEFRMPFKQRIVFRRDGVTYSVRQRSRGRNPYRYAIGVDIGGDHVETFNYDVCYESYQGAVNAVRGMMIHDPRQTDIPPAAKATHFSISISASTNE